MLIHLVNPNSTAAMTARAQAVAEAVASAGTRFLAVNPPATPVSIEGHADEAISVPAMLALIAEAEAEGAAAHVVACFDDPGLGAAREIASGPVIGLCQAAVQVATTIAARFSVVTTLPRSVPIIEDLVAAYGAGHQCRRVRSAELPVLALEDDPANAYRDILAQIRAARDQDGAEAVILGCAGMADLARRLSAESGLTVIEPVAAAVRLAEALAGGGFRTSKIGAYAYPNPKHGGFSGWAAGRPAAAHGLDVSHG